MITSETALAIANQKAIVLALCEKARAELGES